MPYKPEGYSSVSPYLIVADPEKTLAFLAAVFGCTPLRTARREDGFIRHTEVRIEDTVVMIGGSPDGQPGHVHVYVEDPDQRFAAAQAAGGTVVQTVDVRDDGDRRGGIQDPSGTIWWLSRSGEG